MFCASIKGKTNIFYDEQKKCPKCGIKQVKKNGIRDRIQRYKCKSCNYQWQNNKRNKNKWIKELYEEYSFGKQTYNQLRDKYSIDPKTVRKYFDGYNPCIGEIKVIRKPINLVFDATFFKRTFGFLVFRTNSKNIYWKQVDSEKVIYLSECFDALDACEFQFKSFTIDGKRGFIRLLERRYPSVPIQFCQFHQRAIVRRYNTKNPQTSCGQELNFLMNIFTKVDRNTFIKEFNNLKEKYDSFLKEKNDKGQFVHKRLRSAFRSLKTNLPYLFTYKDHPELNIPNTTNSCEGSFSHLKNKIKLHRGMSEKRIVKMVNYFLENN